MKELLKTINIVSLTDDQIEKILKYVDFLKQENQSKNLISRKATDEDILKFIKSSLVFVKHMKDLSIDKVLDMGSGSGFPSIICAICFPDIKFSVMDSIQKKIDFLYDVSLFLQLKNVECFWGRMEDFAGASGLKESFDIVTAMAVGGIELTTDYAMPFLNKGGMFLTIKSYNQEQECERAKNYMNKISANMDLFKEELVESFMILIGKN